MIRLLGAVPGAVFSLCIFFCVDFAAGQIVWVGPATGNWNDPANWSGGMVPDDPAAAVVIDQQLAQQTQVELTDLRRVGALSIDSGDRVTLAGAEARLDFGGAGDAPAALTINGQLFMQPENGSALIQSQAEPLTIGGSGELAMFASGSFPNSTIRGQVVFEPGLTVRGVGHITGAITNRTTITAERLGMTFGTDFNPPVPARNMGLLVATGTSSFTLTRDIDNTGGVIEATDASTRVFLSDVTLTNGVLRGKGKFVSTSSITPLVLRDVQVDAPIEFNSSNGSLQLGGSMLINSEITVASPSSARLNVAPMGATTLSGTGVINLNGGSVSAPSAASITNQITIIGLRSLQVPTTNHGTIVAVGASTISTTSITSIVNRGTIRHEPASSFDGPLRIWGGTFDNAGGTIIDEGGGLVLGRSASPTTILGGTLSAAAGATIDFSSTVTLNGVRFGGSMENRGRLRIDQSIINTGTIKTDFPSALGGVTVAAQEATITGGGILVFTRGSEISPGIRGTNTSRLINVDNTIAFSESLLDVSSIIGAPKFSNAGSMITNGPRARLTPPETVDGFINTGCIDLPQPLLIRGSIDNQNVVNLNSALAIDYTGTSPIAVIAAQIASGYAAGSWNGTGIRSSQAAGDPRLAVGYAEAADVIPGAIDWELYSIDDTTLLTRLTLAGDADLNRTVDLSDFSRLANNFNLPGRWAQGDFDYSGQVTAGDFALMAANFNQTIAARSTVPEPHLAATLLLGLLSLRRVVHHAPL